MLGFGAIRDGGPLEQVWHLTTEERPQMNVSIGLPAWDGLGEDSCMAVKALWGVSHSPPMPRYPAYVEFIEARAERWCRGPGGLELFSRVEDVVEAHGDRKAPVESVPWEPSRPIRLRRSFAALVS